MIDLELYRKIRRLYNEGHSQRRIARILGCCRKTIRKYCQGAALPDARAERSLAGTSPQLALEKEIRALLVENKSLPRKQRRSATDIWRELKKRGFTAGESTVRRYVRKLAGEDPEGFVPLDFSPGEAMQVDWGDMRAFIGGESANVSAFVTVLPYSGAPYASVFPNKSEVCFLEGHVRAFNFYGGVVRRCIYDNSKNAVIQGAGVTAVKHDDLKKLEAHYGFDSAFTNPGAPWEKGGIENVVAVIRRIAFTPMPHVEDYAELQQHVDGRCLEYIETHRIRYRPSSIREMFEEERRSLAPLPLTPMETAETVSALVNTDLTVLFEGSRYSVPLPYVGERVTLKVSPFTVAVWARGDLVCSHKRALKKGDHQYDPLHYLDLLTSKPRSIANAAPLRRGVMPKELQVFLSLCRDRDREQQLLEVLLLSRIVDPDTLLWAVRRANSSGAPTCRMVRFYLDIGAGEPEEESLPGITVEHADLKEYDRLVEDEDRDE
jgi:transposase